MNSFSNQLSPLQRSHLVQTEQPVVGRQSSSSFVPNVIKTNVLLNNNDLAHKDLLLQQYGERIDKLSQQDKLSKFCMDARFLNVVEIGQYFMTKDTAEFSQFRAVACREYSLPRDEEASQPKGWIQGLPHVGCTVSTELRSELCLFSWRICVNTGCERFCMPIKGQSKTTKKRTCRLLTKNNSFREKNVDRCWTRGIFVLRLWNIEEIDSSSSSLKSSTSRRWWSGSILENQEISSKTFPVLSSLVWRQVEEKHGKRRRKQEEIPVLHWFFEKNRVSPSSSRSSTTQSYWSYSTGQCCYSEQLFVVHLSCRMCFQFALHHEFRIGTRRTNFEQKTDGILHVCGSYEQGTQRSE